MLIAAKVVPRNVSFSPRLHFLLQKRRFLKFLSRTRTIWFRKPSLPAQLRRSSINFAAMRIEFTANEKAIAEKISKAAQALGADAYFVGGFVRDKILGRPSKDIDIVTTGDGVALAEAAAKAFPNASQVNVFKNFGTAQIKLPDVELEFVGARKESYSRHSRKPAVEAGTLLDDQNRRDFTINAMAVGISADSFGQLIDPFNGLAHLQERVLRTPLEPGVTYSDDPLRMMRAIRFATQLGFAIHPESLNAIVQMADRIKIVSGERITEELNKIVMAEKPSTGFKLLYDTGLLKVIFPQMVALAGAEYVDGKGHKDNFYHTLQVLDNIAPNTDNIWLRWAAILHDIGKPATKKFEPGHGWTFHGHEVVGGRMVPKIFTQLKLPLHEPMRYVRKLVELHLRPISLTKESITDSAIRRLLFDAGDDFDDLMLLCSADITSKNKEKVRRYLDNFELVKERCAEVEAKDQIRNWQPPITGEKIMETFGIAPSKPVGIIKDAIRNAILDGVIPNEYEPAYAYMIEQGRAIGLAPVRG